MDLMTAILTRRSIRRFQNKPVPREILQELIRAAMYAPSAGNEKLWHFVIVDDRKTLDRVAAEHPYAKMAAEAPVGILVCADETLAKHPLYWPQDCAAATQNILLTAHAKGLGAVWVGVHPREDRVAVFRGVLPLPANIIPFSFIPLGYPAEKKTAEERFDSSRIHQNSW